MIAPPLPPPPLTTPAVVATASASASRAAALAAARRRWAKAGIKSYTYTAAPAGQAQIPPAKVVVRGGRATVTPKGDVYDDLKTVPRLFALIAKEIAAKPYTLDVRYAPRTGVPTSFSVDEEKLAVDDVWGFGVRGFRAL